MTFSTQTADSTPRGYREDTEWAACGRREAQLGREARPLEGGPGRPLEVDCADPLEGVNHECPKAIVVDVEGDLCGASLRGGSA